MDGTVYTVLTSAACSAATAFGVVALTNLFARKRDHEADWRKMKLEHYREYVAALSGVVHHGTFKDAQRRYADAVNSLALVAPPNVLEALYAFQDEVSIKNPNRTDLQNEALLSSLLRNMRDDCHPESPKDKKDFIFRAMDVPHPSEKGVRR